MVEAGVTYEGVILAGRTEEAISPIRGSAVEREAGRNPKAYPGQNLEIPRIEVASELQQKMLVDALAENLAAAIRNMR